VFLVRSNADALEIAEPESWKVSPRTTSPFILA